MEQIKSITFQAGILALAIGLGFTLGCVSRSFGFSFSSGVKIKTADFVLKAPVAFILRKASQGDVEGEQKSSLITLGL